MTERLFNLFVFVDDGIIRELGATTHDREGTDQEKLNFFKLKFRPTFQQRAVFRCRPVTF